jgi:hypothetical protein
MFELFKNYLPKSDTGKAIIFFIISLLCLAGVVYMILSGELKFG